MISIDMFGLMLLDMMIIATALLEIALVPHFLDHLQTPLCWTITTVSQVTILVTDRCVTCTLLMTHYGTVMGASVLTTTAVLLWGCRGSSDSFLSNSKMT